MKFQYPKQKFQYPERIDETQEGKKCVMKTGKLELTHSLEIETESQRVALHGLFCLLIVNDISIPAGDQVSISPADRILTGDDTTEESVSDEQPQNA